MCPLVSVHSLGLVCSYCYFFFLFRGKIYKQRFGAAMGSPVSPVIANLYMKFLEQQAITTVSINCRPRLWKRYVDDILEIVKADQADNLTDYLNKSDPTRNIKFTNEQEKGGTIPFLDTLIACKPDGPVKLLVYRKATHTDQYLNFSSHHPILKKVRRYLHPPLQNAQCGHRG